MENTQHWSGDRTRCKCCTYEFPVLFIKQKGQRSIDKGLAADQTKHFRIGIHNHPIIINLAEGSSTVLDHLLVNDAGPLQDTSGKLLEVKTEQNCLVTFGFIARLDRDHGIDSRQQAGLFHQKIGNGNMGQLQSFNDGAERPLRDRARVKRFDETAQKIPFSGKTGKKGCAAGTVLAPSGVQEVLPGGDNLLTPVFDMSGNFRVGFRCSGMELQCGSSFK